MYVMKPNPRDRPVMWSCMIWLSTISPNCSKYCRKSSSRVSGLSPPTKIFRFCAAAPPLPPRPASRPASPGGTDTLASTTRPSIVCLSAHACLAESPSAMVTKPKPRGLPVDLSRITTCGEGGGGAGGVSSAPFRARGARTGHGGAAPNPRRGPLTTSARPP